MPNPGAKGSDFEREIAEKLSLWWTDEVRTDIFWRSTTSGARATQRAKKGQTTAQQYGDICAIDPTGEPFIKTITLELKRGYSQRSIHDLLDRADTAGYQEWEGFIQKAHDSHVQANSFAWAIITRRTYRTAWVWMPKRLVAAIQWAGGWQHGLPHPHIKANVFIRKDKSKKNSGNIGPVDIFGCKWERFLSTVTKGHIINIHNRERGNET